MAVRPRITQTSKLELQVCIGLILTQTRTGWRYNIPVRRVIKFGGTSIATPELVREAARHVARLVEYGEQLAVVVSAPGNATSELLSAIARASEAGADFTDSCRFAALGEEQSVHLMTAALRSFGITSQPFLPRDTETWPIIADIEDTSPLAQAKVNEERPFRLRSQPTASRFRRFILPVLRVGTVPVISGFFAVDSSDRVVALGRGGSDISAFIVATQISADEVVIVTDVKGVLSADPRLAENPRLLQELSLADLEMISGAGARVLHPRALEFMNDHLRVRLLDYRELEQLEETGTSVFGSSGTSLYCNPQELVMLTLVGDLDGLPGLNKVLFEWQSALAQPPVGYSRSERFICFYVDSALADQAYAGLHQRLVGANIELTSLSQRGGIGEIRLRSAKFIEQPGVLAEICSLLANTRINIIELITGLTDITLFIDHRNLASAETLLRRALERYN
jgi:aspartate kinase